MPMRIGLAVRVFIIEILQELPLALNGTCRILHKLFRISSTIQCIDNVHTNIYHESMTTIQVRTNERTKRTAQQILEKLGLDLSTAINIYLVQIIEKKGIPFEVLTENGLTAAEEEEILHEIASAKKSKKSYASAKEAHRAILGA